MKKLTTIIFLLFFINSFTQDFEEKIVIQQISENEINLSSIDTPLTQIAGAPEPFYTYWWEFGDGHYSTEDFPNHTYTKNGNYDILLARTNNYNDGKGRPKKKKTFQSSGSTLASLDSHEPYLASNENLSIDKNQDPKPDEEIVFAQTYQNTSGIAQSGTLYFFYNETAFENNHFTFQEYRRHHDEERITDVKKVAVLKQIDLLNENLSSAIIDRKGDYIFSNNDIETSISNSIAKEETSVKKSFNSNKQLKKEMTLAFENYKDVLAWNFSNFKAEDERNLFLSFKTTKEMLTDTNVSISIQAFFVPDDIEYATSVKEIMPIVTAHDPNKLIVNKNKTYRGFSKNKAIEYEIKFQNVGKGPAEEVKLRFYNNADIDIENLEILDFEPKCELCTENCAGSYFDTLVTKKYVEFFFHNIYLPGTRQSDIESRDASKGFVKFKLNTEQKVKQNNLTCRTEIYFDKEDPIRTNNAKTIFQKRIYFGAELGVDYFPISFPKYDLFARGTFTYRLTKNWYYRAELGVSYSPPSIEENIQTIDTNFITNNFGYSFVDSAGIFRETAPEDSVSATGYTSISSIETIIKKQNIKLDFVPIEIRRDINKFISLGVGINSTINLVSFSKIQFTNTTKLYDINFQSTITQTRIPPPAAGGNVTYDISQEVEASMFKYSNTNSSEISKTKTYDLDFISGLFVDVNIGKIYSYPYFGARAKVDYNFMNKEVYPALQFYVGANF